ncbi:hypothetical protein P175DRAFT_0504410 [Aspergillus ochraceoroseus IBT 24754]|uniref:Uncharacterized protein n=1 Tax=Aspergillus ochraceoroseus IBT 24754 TaxID=1392256 RepID=A0A2T5LN15_9EURO|nr:uncharacterized protein P175DRAFT_0504410 [Aspergillus ochraceoroseus IBT 24754]PTU17666.1 hypothetical protein P175DRAFT_0504410 [Aspergillus ochraceoroseus IBT 24754]
MEHARSSHLKDPILFLSFLLITTIYNLRLNLGKPQKLTISNPYPIKAQFNSAAFLVTDDEPN